MESGVGRSIKEGTIFRLLASLDIDALQCSNYCKMIARAVQNYGFVIVATSGAGFIVFRAENPGKHYYPDGDPYYTGWAGSVVAPDTLSGRARSSKTRT